MGRLDTHCRNTVGVHCLAVSQATPKSASASASASASIGPRTRQRRRKPPVRRGLAGAGGRTSRPRGQAEDQAEANQEAWWRRLRAHGEHLYPRRCGCPANPWFIDRAKLEDFDNSAGKTPPALLAIDRLERVVTIGKRCLEIEASLGAISHEELQYWVECIAQTLHRFLPPEKEAAAKAFLRERIRAREQVITTPNIEA